MSGTVVVKENGSTATGWTVDTTTGVVTVSNTTKLTTGHALTVSCEFDVPVRFDTDEMKVSINDYNNFTWGQTPLVGLRVSTG